LHYLRDFNELLLVDTALGLAAGEAEDGGVGPAAVLEPVQDVLGFGEAPFRIRVTVL
jgi:hypothetical protein